MRIITLIDFFRPLYYNKDKVLLEKSSSHTHPNVFYLVRYYMSGVSFTRTNIWDSLLGQMISLE
jgi:hypothetical protein